MGSKKDVEPNFIIMKKTIQPILEVDFIGDQDTSITNEEQKKISAYFQKKKAQKWANKKAKLTAINP